jgi:hypothetical protein
VAVRGLEDGQAGDPEFLAGIEPFASRLTIGEGEQKTVNLELKTR